MSPLKRIASILLVSSLVMSIFLVAYLSYSLRESAVQQWVESRSHLVRQLSAVVDDELSEAQEKLEFLKATKPFQEPLDPSLIDLNVNGIPLGVDSDRRDLLDGILEGHYHGFNVVFILLPNGDHYLSHPYSIQESLETYNLSQRSYFQEAVKSRQPVVSDRFVGADGRSAVAIDVPVLNENGEIDYHIGGVFHLVRAGILIDVDDSNGYDQGTFLLDGQGQMITSRGTLPPGVKEELSRLITLDDGPFESSDRVSETGTTLPEVLHYPMGEKDNMVIMSRLKCGWTLVVVADLQVVAAHYQPQVMKTAILGGLLLLVISSITFLLIHRVGSGWEDTSLRMKKSHDLTETALLERENLFDAITNQSVEGITVADVEGKYTFVNPAFCTMMGYSADELLQMTVFDVKAKSQDTSSFSRSKSSKEGLPFQVYLQRKDGSEFYSEVLGKMIEVGGNKAVLGTVRDITERLQHDEERLNLERQIQHAQKLESLGVLAGGIAHDFNNLLMAILGNADLALTQLSPMSPARENLHEIEGASRRAAELARQMLAYSGRGRFVIEAISLDVLIKEIAHLLEVSISKKVELKLNFAENLPTFEGDATQIRQIVMNLITNASEAIGDNNGVVRLSTGSSYCDGEYLKSANMGIGMDAPLEEGLYTYMEVSDTGCGMDNETIAKVFDPFFTTKFTGRGLGMSAVQGIVRGHHGAIMVYSEIAKGTTFKVLFKANESERPELKSGSDVNAVKGDSKTQYSGTVLVVDDEETVLAVAGKMLESMGFDVLFAADGRQGIEIYKAEFSTIVCVLLDLTMPQLDGGETFIQMRQINPDAKIVLCSGYNEMDATQSFPGESLAGFIQKPFNLRKLREKIGEVLQG